MHGPILITASSEYYMPVKSSSACLRANMHHAYTTYEHFIFVKCIYRPEFEFVFYIIVPVDIVIYTSTDILDIRAVCQFILYTFSDIIIVI